MSLLTSSLRHWGSPNAKINSLIPSPTLLRSVDAMPIPKEKNDLVLLSNATRARSISHRSYSCCSWGNSCRYFSISHASFIVYFPILTHPLSSSTITLRSINTRSYTPIVYWPRIIYYRPKAGRDLIYCPDAPQDTSWISSRPRKPLEDWEWAEKLNEACHDAQWPTYSKHSFLYLNQNCVYDTMNQDQVVSQLKSCHVA